MSYSALIGWSYLWPLHSRLPFCGNINIFKWTLGGKKQTILGKEKKLQLNLLCPTAKESCMYAEHVNYFNEPCVRLFGK